MRLIIVLLLTTLAACSSGSDDPSDVDISERVLGGWYCYTDPGNSNFWLYSVFLRDGTYRSIGRFGSIDATIPDESNEDWQAGIWWKTEPDEITVQIASNGLLLPYRFSDGTLSLPEEGFAYQKCYTRRL